MVFFTLCKHTLQQIPSVYSLTAARDHRGYPMNHPSRVSLQRLSTVVNWHNRRTYYGRSEEAKMSTRTRAITSGNLPFLPRRRVVRSLLEP